MNYGIKPGGADVILDLVSDRQVAAPNDQVERLQVRLSFARRSIIHSAIRYVWLVR